MIKIELYKDGDLVLSTDGKIDDRLLVFGNIIYDLDKDYFKLIERESPLFQSQNEIRKPFARDYTRLLHCTAYRRLKHKTQVFYNIESETQINNRIVLTFD